MTTQNKVTIAEILGTKAFNEGQKRVFALDNQASELLEDNEIGNPQNHKIMDAWYKNWDLSNLNADLKYRVLRTNVNKSRYDVFTHNSYDRAKKRVEELKTIYKGDWKYEIIVVE